MRWNFRALGGLTVLLATGSQASANGHILFHPLQWFHHHHGQQGMPGSSVSPITPGQIANGLQLAQGGLQLLQGFFGGNNQQQQNTPQPPPVDPAVFTSLGKSEKTLTGTITGVNALLAKVRKQDTRYTTDNLPDVPALATTPASGGAGGVVTIKPGPNG
jgi:hypothetical protein